MFQLFLCVIVLPAAGQLHRGGDFLADVAVQILTPANQVNIMPAVLTDVLVIDIASGDERIVAKAVDVGIAILHIGHL